MSRQFVVSNNGCEVGLASSCLHQDLWTPSKGKLTPCIGHNPGSDSQLPVWRPFTRKRLRQACDRFVNNPGLDELSVFAVIRSRSEHIPPQD